MVDTKKHRQEDPKTITNTTILYTNDDDSDTEETTKVDEDKEDKEVGLAMEFYLELNAHCRLFLRPELRRNLIPLVFA